MAGEFQGRIGTIDSANWLIGSVLDTLNKWEGALALIGLVCPAKFVAVYGWEFLKACRVYVFEPLIAGKKDWVRKYGRWAGELFFQSIASKTSKSRLTLYIKDGVCILNYLCLF